MRDEMYAARIRAEATQLGLTTLTTGEGSTPGELTARVESAFGLR